MKKIVKNIILLIMVILILHFALKIKIINISVEGLTKYNEDKFISMIFKDEESRTSLTFFIKDILFKHDKINHIDNYKVVWKTPFTIVIQVEENEPVGFIKKDIKNVYFDKDGVVSEISDNRKQKIPEVLGIEFNEFRKGEKLNVLDKDLFDFVLEVTNYIKKKEFPLELLDTSKKDDIKLYLKKIIVEFGDMKNMDIKLTRLTDIYKEIKDLSGTLDLKEAKKNMIDEQYIFKKSN